MGELTVNQYQDAITRQLSPRQIEILQILYHFPNSSATAIQLAQVLGYESYRGANRQIGALGEAFYKETGLEPPVYKNNSEKFAYFYHVGEYNKRGWNMWPELKKALENLGLVEEKISKTAYTDRLPTETMPFEEGKFYKEGKVIEVFVNRYERKRNARLDCIKHYGAICYGCGFDFGNFYGSTAEGFIHVHHILPLADIRESYTINPITDLVPLCANCHSVVHMTKPTLTLVELRKLTKKSIGNKILPKYTSTSDLK